MSRSLKDRLLSRVQEADSGCWMWSGQVTSNGYGRIRQKVDGRWVMSYVHRVAYEIFTGPIVGGNQIDHICRVRHCCNPDHLRSVTSKENHEHTTSRNCSKTGLRGVSWSKSVGKYAVQVTHNYKLYHGGYFTSVTEAEKAAIALRNRLFTHNDLDRVEEKC